MDTIKYKEFEGTAEIDMSSLQCRGKILFIKDLVTYVADSPAELQNEFEIAVDDYLKTRDKIDKALKKNFEIHKSSREILGIGFLPNRKRTALYQMYENQITPLAYFKKDVDVKWVEQFLEEIVNIANKSKQTILQEAWERLGRARDPLDPGFYVCNSILSDHWEAMEKALFGE